MRYAAPATTVGPPQTLRAKRVRAAGVEMRDWLVVLREAAGPHLAREAAL